MGLHTSEVICTARRADVSGVWYESFNPRIGRSHSMGAWLTFLCYKRILRTRLEHHVCAPPRLIVDQAPFVALADVVNSHKDITVPQHDAGRRLARNGRRPVDRLRLVGSGDVLDDAPADVVPDVDAESEVCFRLRPRGRTGSTRSNTTASACWCA